MLAKNDYVTKNEFQEAIAQILERLQKLDKIADKLDWFTGKYTKFEEEQAVMGESIIDHGERIEKLEKKVGIYAS